MRLDAEILVNRADLGLTYSPMRMASLNNTIVIHAVFTFFGGLRVVAKGTSV